MQLESINIVVKLFNGENSKIVKKFFEKRLQKLLTINVEGDILCIQLIC